MNEGMRHGAIAAGVIVVIVLTAITLRGLNAPFDFDEQYHVATVDQVRQQFPSIGWRSTPTATPLLYHLVAAAVAGWTGATTSAARVTTAIMSIGLLWGLYALARWRLGLRSPLLDTVTVALHPAVLWYTTMAMTELPSMTWAVASIVALTFMSRPALSGLVAGGCLGLAIWTRQSWIFLAMSFVLAGCLQLRTDRRIVRVPVLVAGLVGALAAIALFAMWGGLHPRESSRRRITSPSTSRNHCSVLQWSASICPFLQWPGGPAFWIWAWRLS